MTGTERLRRIAAGLSALTLLALAAACSMAPPDSPEARLELAQTITGMEVGGGALDKTLDQGADLAVESTAEMLTIEIGRELTDDELDRVRGVMRAALAEFVTEEEWRAAVADVYAEHFTTAELQDVIDFYGSPVGGKILELQGELNEQIGNATEEILEAHLEEFIARVDEGLAGEFPGLAEGEGQ